MLALLDEIERLRGAVVFLVQGLRRVQVRPAQESAFIAAVYLDDAKKRYGIDIDAALAAREQEHQHE